MHTILANFGVLIIERTGSDVWAFLLAHDLLYEHRRNVIVVKQLIYNDISSTKIRLFVKRGFSIQVCKGPAIHDFCLKQIVPRPGRRHRIHIQASLVFDMKPGPKDQ